MLWPVVWVRTEDSTVFAIIQSGGRQVKVSPGDLITVDRVPANAGDEVTIDQVLVLEKDGGEVLAGSPYVANVKVVGISRDPMKSHEKFIGKYGLGIPLASDEDGRVSEAFGTWIEKSMYGRKYMGMERSTYLIGVDGQVLKAWRKVKVPNHAEEVLKAARQFAPA